MKKRMAIMLVLAALVFGGIFGFKVFQGMMIKKFMTAPPPPAVVSTARAELEDWQPKLEAVGSLRAINGADLSAQAAGLVDSIHFESGSDVEAGTVLVRLDAGEEIARMQSLKAQEKLAQINYDRDEKQLKAQIISQATLDADIANLQSLKAQVAEAQAVIDDKVVKAPFAGRLGIRKVDLGQYLNPGAPVVTLQQLDPIYADFTLPEQAAADLKVGQKAMAHSDAHPDRDFEGEITAINPRVDEATRTIGVRATFKNPDHLLLPGMFARVNVETAAPEKQLTLPLASITFNPYGSTVYLAVPKEDGKGLMAKQTFVTTGAQRGDQVVVLSGVKEGDEVVTAGQIKLRNGAAITINNEIKPKNDANPKPEDR